MVVDSLVVERALGEPQVGREMEFCGFRGIGCSGLEGVGQVERGTADSDVVVDSRAWRWRDQEEHHSWNGAGFMVLAV